MPPQTPPPQIPQPPETLMPPEPYPDIPPPTPSNEEIVDPTIPVGSAVQVIIKRHPFGLVALYLQAAVGIGVALGLIFFLVPSLVSGDNKNHILNLLAMVSVIIVMLALIFLLLATIIYRSSFWVITDDSVSQHLRIGLFRQQTSELSMANIEDVTAEQKGILAELFGFGLIKCETAGELPYFHFNYCPNPNKYAKIILDARERFINEDPQAAKRANELLNVPRG